MPRRYEMLDASEDGNSYMFETKIGDYVEYSEYEADIAERDAKIAELERKLDRIRDIL